MTEKDFIELINSNQGIIYKICRLYTHNEADSEDLFQEIVLQLWKSIHNFKGDSKISTWMYRVGLNTAITIFRKKSKSIDIQDIEQTKSVFLKSNSEDIEKDERINYLYETIKQLTDIERALIMLYLDDLPYKDIAETLGITEVNARVKMNRTKEKLKKMMTNG